MAKAPRSGEKQLLRKPPRKSARTTRGWKLLEVW